MSSISPCSSSPSAEKSSGVRLRFAPSPTGFLHLGNTRTALFNWVFARQQKGCFVLRMDDTDQQRNKKEYADSIQEDLRWLGLTWDEYYCQSERLGLYEKAKNLLIASGRLYPCWETPEELDRQRSLLLAQKKPPLYNRASWIQWRQYLESKNICFSTWTTSQSLQDILQGHGFQQTEDTVAPSGQEFLYPQEENIQQLVKELQESLGKDHPPHWRFLLTGELCTWEDAIQGHQSISPRHFSDPVVVREDGNIGYLLASVVDDIDLNITHVVRGSDHISNTAIQLQLFQSLHVPSLPHFCHFPLLSSLGGQKLSKRLGSLNMQQLRQGGFLPYVVLGTLGNLGCHHLTPIKPFFLEDFLQNFSFQDYTKSNVQFDEDSLLYHQEHAVHDLSYEDFLRFCPQEHQVPETSWLFLRENIVFFPELDHWKEVLNHDLFWPSQQWTEDLELPKGKIPLGFAQEICTWGQEAFALGEDMLSFVWSKRSPDVYCETQNPVSQEKEKLPLDKKDIAMILRLGLTGLKKGPKLQHFIDFFRQNSLQKK